MALVTPTNVTGFSGFWQYHAPVGQTAPYQPKYGRSSHEYQAALALGKMGFRKYRAQMRALNGAVVGGTATDSLKRVQSGQAMYDAQYGGGLRTMQTVNNNTTTTAGMQSAINALVYDRISKVVTYPRDLSGNGGGSKVGR